jgi:hypothetical protein
LCDDFEFHGNTLSAGLCLVSIRQFRHAVKAKIVMGHVTGMHRRAKALFCEPPIDPAGFEAVTIGRLMIMEHAFGGVQDI